MLGQRVHHGGNLFRHYLAGPIDIGAPIKLHPYDGESRSGRRAHTAHIGGTVHGSLNGERHKSLHLLGRHTLGLGHHRHRRRIEVREHIHIHRRGGIHTCHHQQHRQHEHEQTVVERETYNLV